MQLGADGLTPKQARFVAEYLVDLNATQAAIRAGYSAKTAKAQASQLLVKHNIAAAISKKRQSQIRKADLNAARTLEELRRLSLVDIRGFYREDGSLKPMHELTEEQGSQLASVETIVKNVAGGDGHTDTVHKIKLWDKPRNLEMLAKHFALLTDVVRVEAEEALIERLARGRQRADDVKK